MYAMLYEIVLHLTTNKLHITRSFTGIFALLLTSAKLALGGDLHLLIKTELTH